MSETEERSRFEKWATRRNFVLVRDSADSLYMNHSTECAWRAWRAALEDRQQELHKIRAFLADETPDEDRMARILLDAILEDRQEAAPAKEIAKIGPTTEDDMYARKWRITVEHIRGTWLVLIYHGRTLDGTASADDLGMALSMAHELFGTVIHNPCHDISEAETSEINHMVLGVMPTIGVNDAE